MTVYVTLLTEHGALQDVRAYLTLESAQRVEREWLRLREVSTEAEREALAAQGTSFTVREVPLHP